MLALFSNQTSQSDSPVPTTQARHGIHAHAYIEYLLFLVLDHLPRHRARVVAQL